MTRENKLAIVIGFGLLLFVGILVSDHLSARSAHIANPQTTAVRLDPPLSLPGGQPRQFGSGVEPALPSRPTDGSFSIDDGNRLDVPQTPAPAFAEESQPTPPAAKERVHVIAKGETLGDVAKRYYGKRSLGVKLAEFNAVDASRLKIGQQVKVPDLAVLDPASAPIPTADAEALRLARGGAESPIPQPAPEGVALPVAPVGESEAPRFGTVKVVEGDTLYRIAKRVYGDGTRWTEIAALNNLGDGRTLKPGRELKYALAR